MTRVTLSESEKAVRVIGVRRGLYVEFEFIAGDPLLTVELIMPFGAFQEFCAANEVVMLPAAAEVQEAFSLLGMRNKGRPPIRIVK